MGSQLIAPLVAAIATVGAALIAAALSFVNLTLNKEQKISEFRQAWIDGLREDLVAFAAGARTFARATQELRAAQENGTTASPFAVTPDKISDIRYRAAETRYRIQLRLNAKDETHRELLRLIQVAIEEQNSFWGGRSDAAKTLKAIDNAANFGPTILKFEWNRVKAGEPGFQKAKNVAVAVMAISFALVSLVLVAMLRSS